ncbi:hypothetical protein [Mesobacillus subterraneus]|uniref:hypothetical protein n=1 Tax=Mesobacillus subterraneus TaxID=285983 RepID=UPI000AB78917
MMKISESTLVHTEVGPKVPTESKDPEATVKKGLSKKAKDNLAGYLFISPWIIGFLGLTMGYCSVWLQVLLITILPQK